TSPSRRIWASDRRASPAPRRRSAWVARLAASLLFVRVRLLRRPLEELHLPLALHRLYCHPERDAFVFVEGRIWASDRRASPAPRDEEAAPRRASLLRSAYAARR